MTSQPLELKIASLDGSYHQISDRLNSIDRRLEGIDVRFQHIDARFDHVNARFDQIDARFQQTDAKIDSRADALQWRMTSLILVTWVTLMVAMLFHH